MPRINSHYIQKAYLKLFANTPTTIFVYDQMKNSICNLPIQSVANQVGLYEVLDESGRCVDMEHSSLIREIENAGIVAIKQTLTRGTVEATTKEALARYMVFSSVRGPGFKHRYLSQLIRRTNAILEKEGFSSSLGVTGVPLLLQRRPQSPWPPHAVAEITPGEHLEAAMSGLMHFHLMQDHLMRLVPQLLRCSWMVLQSDQAPFLTTDNPLVLFNELPNHDTEVSI